MGRATPPKKTGLDEDHRVRVGRQRRERMRAHLLESVMAVYPEGTATSPTVVDDVVRHAEVSRGTFYKYFESLDEAVAELAAEIADEKVDAVRWLYAPLTEPPMRTAIGFQTYLLHAYFDHRWGAFLSHIGLLAPNNPMVQRIVADIRMGMDTGDYVVASPEIATDLLLGAKIEAIRRIISGEADTTYIRAITAMVLRAFAVSPSKSEKVVQRSFELLCNEAPQRISWWKPLD